jgi:hypothetical protein
MKRMTPDEVIKTYHLTCTPISYVVWPLMWQYCPLHKADFGVYLILPDMKSRYEVAMAERRN